MTELEVLKHRIRQGWINEDKAKLINDLLTIDSKTKAEVWRIFLTEEEINKLDFAYPEEIAVKIREINPNWKGQYECYNYNNSVFGEMYNWGLGLLDHIFKTFRND